MGKIVLDDITAEVVDEEESQVAQMTGITLTNNDNKEDDILLATAITGITIANNTSNNPTVDDKEGKMREVKRP
eukprot:311640-Ditylum_brightwellii.AAC.1